MSDAGDHSVNPASMGELAMTTHQIGASDDAKTPFYKLLYVQVLFAILLGGLVGTFFPAFATNEWIKAMGDGFVKLIRW